MLKLEMMLCVMMLLLVVVGCTSWIQSVSQCVKPLPPPAWIMQLPLTAGHFAESDYFTLREADHLRKTTGRNPEVY